MTPIPGQISLKFSVWLGEKQDEGGWGSRMDGRGGWGMGVGGRAGDEGGGGRLGRRVGGKERGGFTVQSVRCVWGGRHLVVQASSKSVAQDQNVAHVVGEHQAHRPAPHRP